MKNILYWLIFWPTELCVYLMEKMFRMDFTGFAGTSLLSNMIDAGFRAAGILSLKTIGETYLHAMRMVNPLARWASN